MEMKRMHIVGLLLIATFALPALAAATLEKDFISHEALKSVLQKVNPAGLKVAMPNEQTVSALTGKILISNSLIDQLLLKHSSIKSLGGGSVPCGESCVWLPCITSTLGCSCSSNVCYYDLDLSDD